MSSATCFLAGNLQIDAAPWVCHEHTVACRAKGDVTLGHAALSHSRLSHSSPSHSTATACPLSNGLKLRSCISPLQHVSNLEFTAAFQRCSSSIAHSVHAKKNVGRNFAKISVKPNFAKAAIDTRRSHTHTHSH